MPQEICYYYRDRQNRPIVTEYLIIEDGHGARGMAVCSKSDNPCKKTGRKIARNRAIKAMSIGRDCLMLGRGEAFAALTETGYFLDHCQYPIYKGEYNPALTKFEQRILTGRENGHESN